MSITSRETLLQLVREFSTHQLSDADAENFRPGETPVPVSGKVLKPDDFVSVVDAALDGWFTSGRFTAEFERAVAKRVGVRSARFVNSGSSANLLALSCLTSPKLGNKTLKVGDEVITAAMGFPTTVNPILQNGLVPVFVDVNMGSYNATAEAVESAIGPKTRAVMLAHTLGNPFEARRISEICNENDLLLIEDCCDAFGATQDNQAVGTFGVTASLSFYPAHHITAGEGGMVLANSPLILRQIESFRDWGRDCYCETGCDNTCKKRFDWDLGALPSGYDHKYIYSHIGYNLKATDLQAALGLSQLADLENFIEIRRRNFNHLYSRLESSADLILPHKTTMSEPSWFGFPITLNADDGAQRTRLTRFLESRKIGSRLMFAGNILKQPAYADIPHRVADGLEVTDRIMNNSFWVGIYPGLSREMLDFTADSILEFLAS